MDRKGAATLSKPEIAEAESQQQINLKRALKPRLTVVESIYHQVPNDAPTQSDSKYSRPLQTDEQPYIRKVKVGQDWQALESGWIKEVSLVKIANAAPQFALRPTEQERAEALAKIITAAVKTEHGEVPFAEILPGESLTFNPLALADLRIRCADGLANCTLTLIPK